MNSTIAKLAINGKSVDRTMPGFIAEGTANDPGRHSDHETQLVSVPG
jgi:hypothetical protein